ncbi:venom acid phosphatase Acph-1-like isoform X2 [Photinus pyralis]|uniref:venom acid phosphatase Acph-1-like isoform X2 n=1 Tax=Photinus pyralis TaxID=7054 RepID=UPI0012672832|nr:venom acid phosphatase Acph-1-like isoform X2 [Photinus pyralis]
MWSGKSTSSVYTDASKQFRKDPIHTLKEMVSLLVLVILYNAVLIVSAGPIENTSNSDELVLLHVLFRHGDRTPDLIEMYPKDPYNNISYFPEGLGQLTRKGKNREYDIGVSMRQKYNSFLGSYKSDEVSAISTDYVRTKMSCLLVLAGLYPPKGKEIWNEHLNWQPVFYNYNPAGKDYLLGDPLYDCPKYRKLYHDYLSSNQALQLMQGKTELYNYLSLHTGLNVTIPRDPYNLQFVLQSEQNLGLKLPQWTESVWPGNITDASVDEYYVNLATPKMQRFAGGVLVKKLLDDTMNKISNNSDPMKIYLYSAHENNLAYQLIFLEAFNPHIPPYGSYLVYEIRKVNGIYGVKILYEDYSKEKPRYLSLPSCGTFCPLDKFNNILQKYVPLAEDICV